MGIDIKLTRSEKNPILCSTERWWENRLVSNAAILQLGDKIHLIYTAHGEDGIARLGYVRLYLVTPAKSACPGRGRVTGSASLSTGVTLSCSCQFCQSRLGINRAMGLLIVSP